MLRYDFSRKIGSNSETKAGIKYMRRVVVTGVGIISPVGNDANTFWNSITNGVSGIGPITRFDTTDYKVKLAAEVKDFDPLKYYDSISDVRRADLFTQYAFAAAAEAVTNSNLMQSGIRPERIGVYVGSGIGGIQTLVTEDQKLHERGPSRVSPLFIPMMISNMAAGAITIKYGFKGPCLPVVTACATSTNSIGEAYRAIKYGYADAIVAGGSEAAIIPISIAGFTSCKALSEVNDPEAASLPFDKRRQGFVMGEGAAIMVLEEYETAVKRGAHIYAEICGYANTADAYHMTAPQPEAEGAAEAIRLACEEANIPAANNIYVNAHGTGTLMNDKIETLALKKVFGSDAYDLHISSTKSMTGHMLGATGAAEAIASVMAIYHNIIPPTINYKENDPDCDLNYTPNEAVKTDVQAAISTSLGFGGHNACVVFKKI